MDRKRILDTGDRIITPDVKIEDCKTQLAAPIRSTGIFILLFRNQTPPISINKQMKIARAIWIITAVENIFFRSPSSPLPNSYVIKRLIAADSELEKTEKSATIPPITV